MNDVPSSTPEYLRVARSQLDSVEDHYQTAQHQLEELRRSLSDTEGEAAREAVVYAFEKKPKLFESCRAIRKNTFDTLARQLSKLVVSAPDVAGDLSPGGFEDAMAEMGQHHDRLIEAVERLDGLVQTNKFDAVAARQAVDDGIRAIDHLDSTTKFVRCLLAKAAPVPTEGRESIADDTSPDAEFVVSGTVTHGDTPVGGLTVRAVDMDLRSEEPLGEATTDADGGYRITYTGSDFERDERKTADVVVRVFNEVDDQLAESTVHYNAGREAIINLQIPPEQGIVPSEYARLQAELDPLLSDRPISALSDDEIDFLKKELNLSDRERFPEGEKTLDVLRTAAELTSRTSFDRRTLYALGRHTVELDRRGLAQSDPAQLAEHVIAAHTENIVDISTEGLRDRLVRQIDRLQRVLELEDKEETSATLRITTPDGDPLTGVSARIQDPDDERKRRTFITDGNGRVTFSYMQPPESSDRSRQFRVTVLNEAGATLHQETVWVTDAEVTEITVTESGSGFSGAESLESLRSEAGAEIPQVNGDTNITLGAIRRAGGIENLDTASSVDPSSREAVNATATMDLLTDPKTSSTLAQHGYTDQVSIAETPLSEFQSTMQGTLDSEQAVQIHATATAQRYLLDSMLVDRLGRLRNGTAPVRTTVENKEGNDVER